MSSQPQQRPVCVDASLAASMPLSEPASAMVRGRWREWLKEERALFAPPHLGPELVSAIRRAGLQGRITHEEEAEAMVIILDEILPAIEIRPVTRQVWHAAWAQAYHLGRSGIYDTLYLALAEDAGAEFWTVDGNLVRALEADGSHAPEWVHLIEP